MLQHRALLQPRNGKKNRRRDADYQMDILGVGFLGRGIEPEG